MVKHPDKMEMMENEIAKLEKPDQVRRSSCLYPNAASRLSSSVGDGFDGSSFLIISVVSGKASDTFEVS